jgi:AAA family ATP:ADP antiporter
VLESRFLLAVGLITVLLNWVNTNGENLLFRVVQDALSEQALGRAIAGAREIAEFQQNGTVAFYGNFYKLVNVSALLLQAFVASRLLKYGGFAAILMLMPVVSLASYGAMALVPILSVVKAMKVAYNATDYSINNTARHVLWLPVSSEVKFKGKPTIDSLFARLGDGFAALTVLLGVQLLALTTELYFVFNVVLVLIWIVFSLVVVREHRRLGQPQGAGAVAPA